MKRRLIPTGASQADGLPKPAEVDGVVSVRNVFKDLGFSDDEAENLKVRADLMIELTRLIEAQKVTQTAAAELLGVTQPRISDLMRGKIDRSRRPADSFRSPLTQA